MASNHQKTIDQRRHTWCSAKIRKGTSPPWVESAINDANCAWKKAKVQGNMVVDQSEHNLRWKGSFYPPPNIRKKRSKKLKGTKFQMMYSYPKQYNICQILIRVDICHDRRNRRLCKIFVSCVNFSKKQRGILLIWQVYTPKCKLYS